MRALDDPNHPGNRPVCENAGVYVWTGVDPGPCSDQCPKHGTGRIERGTLVRVRTVNGGEVDRVVAWTWSGPSYALCVEAGYPGNESHVVWIEAERILSVEPLKSEP